MERRYDLIIIGAGPADMSAAIYGGRAGLKMTMLEMGIPEGKLIKTAEINNWPGIIEANGAGLANDVFEHSTSSGAEYLYGDVIRVEDDAYKKVVCKDGAEYEAKTVIAATGTQERMMDVPGELGNVGYGVSYCAVHDDAFFRDQGVVVISGSNSALGEANYLAQFVSKVNIIIRRDVFRTDSIVQNVIKDDPKITVVTRHVPVHVVGGGIRVTGLAIRNVDTNVETEVRTHGIFPYIGLDPVTSFLEGLDVLDKRSYMIVDENYETKTKDTYGAGGVIAKKLHQVVTATNDGVIVTQYAFREMKGI